MLYTILIKLLDRNIKEDVIFGININKITVSGL